MVVSVANLGHQMAFSSDTGMGDCLVVGIKRKSHVRKPDASQYISLKLRPADFATAEVISKSVNSADKIRTLDDGPYGGTLIKCGDVTLGERLRVVDRVKTGATWGTVRINDYALCQVAYALANGTLWLPGGIAPLNLQTTTISSIGELGLVHRDITGPKPRGAFDLSPPKDHATYSALWNHHASNETRLICKADAELIARIGMEEHADRIWRKATRLHLNQEFTFSSQALAVAFTTTRTMGGSAWPNVVLTEARFEKIFCLWSNTTLGLLMYWWQSNKQQSAKARLTRSAANEVITLDLRTISDQQLSVGEMIFDEFCKLEFMPAYLADADLNRRDFDRAVICDLLGFDDATFRAVRRLAEKWCAEPSVHGGKARPKDAVFQG